MRKSYLRAMAIGFATMVLLQACSNLNARRREVKEQTYFDFPTPLSSKYPFDVDTLLQATLTSEKKFDEVQRLFEILSWQFFIGLNWPRNVEGEPQPEITDPGNPVWYGWKESFEVFKPDGSEPLPWGQYEIPEIVRKEAGDKDRVLFRTSKFSEFHHDDFANEIDQAFTSPIYDQSGNVVRYEVRMNELEFNYVVNNELYNFQGQAEFYQTHAKDKKKVDFPSGDVSQEGVFEIKIAWKVMVDSVDDTSRYYTTKAMVLNEDSTYSEATVGMIGMHISTKTVSAPQWIWTTYEHIDNLETNPLEKVNGKPLKPSFYDTDCPTCPVNLYPIADSNGKKRNQIQRVLPISLATKQLNSQVQGLLAAAGSKLQYYNQVGTQWPTQPDAPAYTYGEKKTFQLPDAITNKSGGYPTPVYLTNMIMETYFQGGTVTLGNGFSVNQQFIDNSSQKVVYEKLYNGQEGNHTEGYNTFLSNEPAFFQIQGFPYDKDVLNTQRMVFGTESCVACHFSGSIARAIVKNSTGKDSVIFGNPADADFSWLLQLKAQLRSN